MTRSFILLLAAALPVLAARKAAKTPKAAATTLSSQTSSGSAPTSSVSASSSVSLSTISSNFDITTQQPAGASPIASFVGPALLQMGSDLKAALDPSTQAGDSPLGLPNAPTFRGPLPGLLPDLPFGLNPPWVVSPLPLPSGFPLPPGNPGRGPQGCTAIDPSNIPNTGQTRYYNLEITYRDIAPDGVTVQGLVINGGFPGPTIEANWGDWIEVTVKNSLTGNGTPEGTTIHWHGLLQKESPFSDGVPSVSQCPIAPGQSTTYRFRADQYGTTWYHSHYSAQYAGGIYGAIVFHGPNDTPQCSGYDTDLGPVLVGDWFHKTYYELVEQTFAAGPPPMSQSNLVNGRGNYPCQKTTEKCTPNAGLSKFKFTKGQKYRMRFINPSAEMTQKISIDNHQFTVIANDFTPVKPYTTDLLTLGVGQRTDVIVEANQASDGSYWLRSTTQANGQSCSLGDGINQNATAVIYYQDANPNTVPADNFTIAASRILDCNNDDLSTTEPLTPISADTTGNIWTQVMNIDYANNGTDSLWVVNNVSARVDYNVNQLEMAVKGTLNPEKEWAVYKIPQSADYARIVMYNSFPFATHPMHLHGHEYQVLATGTGDWDGHIVRPDNPERRDVILVPQATQSGQRGYAVIQYKLDNPAIQILHCHIAWHVSAGLYTAIEEKPDDIRQRQIPPEVDQLCQGWDAFSKTLIVDQIDSGV